MNRPSSLPEWEMYIQGLTETDLYSKAIAANTHSFARSLLHEGATMGDVEQIMLLFTRQLRATGVKIPESGAFDLVMMALVDATARKGITYSQEELELSKSLDNPQEDDFAAFEAGALEG